MSSLFKWPDVEGAVMRCSFCDEITEGHGWTLSDYYGLTGSVCNECYEKVSHDSYGNPKHSEEFLLLKLKFGK